MFIIILLPVTLTAIKGETDTGEGIGLDFEGVTNEGTTLPDVQHTLPD